MKKKIVLIAGEPSHGPGLHEYEATVRLFKSLLEQCELHDRIEVECHSHGWPQDQATLETADLILFYTDGKDVLRCRQMNLEGREVPYVRGDRFDFMDGQIRRGCGMIHVHFSTFVSNEQGRRVLDWTGGYFDSDAGEAWYSDLKCGDFDLELASAEHPVNRGVRSHFSITDDEIYFKMRFRPEDARIIPLLRCPAVRDPHQRDSDLIAWALERADGGRSFSTTLGHKFDNWKVPDIQKQLLNALIWTCGLEVPDQGIETKLNFR